MNRTVSAAFGGIIIGVVAAIFYNLAAPFITRALAPTCSGAQCGVDVYVSGTPPVVSADPPFLRMGGGMSGNNPKLIVWHLKNNDYEFKDDCVQFYDSTATGQFSQVGGSGAQCHVMDANTANPTDDSVWGWGYQIKVYKKGTSNWLSVDPWIVNG